MPIVVSCPGCPTKLSAPDGSAGKHIRCPKCGAITPVPAFIPVEEVPVVEAALTKPKPKPARVDEDDEQEPPRKKKPRDEDEDEPAPRPRTKKRRDKVEDGYARFKRRRRARGSGGMIALCIVGGVLLLVGIGVAIYLLSGKDSPLAKKTPVPPGWEEHSYPIDGFKAYFPKEPEVHTVPTEEFNVDNPRVRREMPPPLVGGLDAFRQVTSISGYTCRDFDGGMNVTVVVGRFRNGTPASLRGEIGDMPKKKQFGFEYRKIRWLGHDVAELSNESTVIRAFVTDRYMFIVQLSGPKGTRAKPEEEQAFFDNFELTR